MSFHRLQALWSPRIIKSPSALLLPIWLCWTKDAIAQEEQLAVADTLPQFPLEEIVFTADRAGRKPMHANGAIARIAGKALLMHAQRSTPEVLNELPGVFVQKTNHGGGSAFLRGLTGNQVLYLLDGIRLNNAITRYGPNQYLNTVDRYALSGMEVLRGSGSVLYGSDAVGGVVQLFSYEPETGGKEGFSGLAISRLGSQHMEYTLHTRAVWRKEDSWATAAWTGRQFGDLPGGRQTGIQRPSGYKEGNVDSKVRLKLGDRHVLQALFQRTRQPEVPVYHKYKLEDFVEHAMAPQHRALGYATYAYSPEKGILRRLSVTASFQEARETRRTRKWGSQVTRMEHDSVNVAGLIAEMETAWQSQSWRWTGSHGVEMYSDRVGSSRQQLDALGQASPPGRGLYPGGARQGSLAGFSHHTFYYRKFQVSAGSRLQWQHIRVPDVSGTPVILRPNAWVGSLQVSREAGKHGQFLLSLSSGFRAPNIDDLGTLGIVDFRYEIPNNQLAPERSWQWQGGYRLNRPRLGLEAYFYRITLLDLIVRNRKGLELREGYPVFIKENAGLAFIRGWETAFCWEFSRHFQLMGQLTHTFGEHISQKEPLRRIPPMFGNLSLRYQSGKYRMGLAALAARKQDQLAAGDIDDNRIGPGGTPGWMVFHLQGGLQLGRVDLSLSLQNLFHADYKYHGSGINAPGRSAILGLIWTL